MTIRELIEKHCNTSRTPVSDESNSLVSDVALVLDADIIKSKSMSEVLTWFIPKYWHVSHGYLKRTNGEVIADFSVNPLYLWTHSISFSDKISKSELEKHIFTDIDRPDIIPYHYRNGFKYDVEEWGFCLPYNVWKNMTDDEYIVDISAELSDNGCMYTGDCYLKGEKDTTYLFAAHTCHPAQCVDGLTNVAVFMEVFKELKKRKLKNSYRFVFGPEYYAAAAFLANTPEHEIEYIKGAFFVDLFGAGGGNIAFSSSFQGNSFIDKVVENVYKYMVNDYEKFSYRELIGNDEMFYNGPGYNIPTITLGETVPEFYHTSDDKLENVCFESLEKQKEIVLKIIEILETDYIPVLKYKGPLYQYRYGIYFDFKTDNQKYKQLEAMQILADGKRSCFDIAEELEADFFFVRNIFDKLVENGLVEKVIAL